MKEEKCGNCSKSVSEVKQRHGGFKNGWLCEICNEAFWLAEKEKAFEKLDGELPNCKYQSEIICPHCGTKISNDDIHESDDDMHCDVCRGDFYLTVEYEPDYSTSIKGERVLK